MAIHELIIPKTGLNMEDCYLLSWLAEEGEEIKEGAPVFQMEIEKAAMDIESDVTGWLHQGWWCPVRVGARWDGDPEECPRNEGRQDLNEPSMTDPSELLIRSVGPDPVLTPVLTPTPTPPGTT